VAGTGGQHRRGGLGAGVDELGDEFVSPSGVGPLDRGRGTRSSRGRACWTVSRGNFPGDDDQLLIVGRQMCRLLYTGQSASAVIATTADQYAASPDQAAALLRAARGTLCTQAPG
jgi:Protein of unknown function (DUF732)